MTHRFESRTRAVRAVSSTRCALGRWLLAGGALLGALACQNYAGPKVHGEPARAPSAATAPVSAAGTASPGAAPNTVAPALAAPSAPLGLAKYEEPGTAASSGAAPSAPAASPPPAASPAPAPTTAGPKAAAGQMVQGTAVDDASFSTWLQTVSPVPAGSPTSVEAVLVAKAPYHCNAEYPHKFKLAAAPAGLTYPESTVKGMQVTAERSVLRIPVVAQSPGKATVSGTLHFSVCNDERCLVEKRELSLNLEVK